MSKCRYCKLCGWANDGDKDFFGWCELHLESYDIDEPRDCPDYIQASNADRLRAMSDEELAVFLDDLTCLCVDCNDHDGVNENCPIYKQGCGRYCEPKDLMNWLQQLAEEDT